MWENGFCDHVYFLNNPYCRRFCPVEKTCNYWLSISKHNLGYHCLYTQSIDVSFFLNTTNGKLSHEKELLHRYKWVVDL